MKRFLVLFLVTFVFSIPAQACLKAGAAPEYIDKVIEDAFFIGKVKVLKRETKGRGSKSRLEATLQSIQSYKGFLPRKIKIVDVCCNSCEKGIPAEGTIYEEIVFVSRRKYSLSMQTQLLPESVWVGLRKEAKPSKLLEQEEAACAARNGLLATHAQGYFINVVDCHVGAASFGKGCKGSEECDGLCLADHYLAEGFQPFFIHEFSPDPKKATLPGRCSPWKDMDGCYHEVKNGKILDQVCKD